MPRRHYEKRVPAPDAIYQSATVSKLINYVMREGKKSAARKIVYGALDIVKGKVEEDSVQALERAIERVAPLMEVRSRRVGGATYQVPVEVKSDRRFGLAVRWILTAARNKKGKPMREKLAEEILLAYKNEGTAVKKREDVHRMAEANRAFAHFAR